MTAVCAALALALLGACTSNTATAKTKSGAVVLNWYLPPSRVDAATLAKSCSNESGGAYSLKLHTLPADADDRHASLVRRLVAKDSSIDLIGLDDMFTAEFAVAQLLAPIPEDKKTEFSAEIFPKALAAASYDGALVAAPWWFDPQLLWYRSAFAERAGIDMTKPVLWEKLIEGAGRLGVSIEVDDFNGHGVPGFVSALVADAGGQVVTGHGRRAKVGLAGAAGKAAASTLQFYADSSNGIGPSDRASARFAGSTGGFLIAPSSVLSDPALASIATDMRWTTYPVVDSEKPAIPPLAGINLAVPLYASHTDLSYDAISCLTSEPSMAALMTSAGHNPARSTTYDIAGVTDSFPMAAVVRPSVEAGAAAPQTPYWSLVRYGLQSTWSPIDQVSASTTPRESQRAVRAALAGELP